jgi:hypothetical protein
MLVGSLREDRYCGLKYKLSFLRVFRGMSVAARLHRTAQKGYAAETVVHWPGSSRNTKTVNQQKLYAIGRMVV